ncbi:DUF4229 domain-containing protein [Streptomyces phytohabitans]|uniref:DUF4229 domain-containing protein n=1 Tax=Streptomyces phytohabitans TaxID=1150371 RepID=UPI00345BA830
MSSSTSHATLRYTLMRLAIFAGCLVVAAVLAYVGVLPEGIGDSNPLWIFLLALLLSAPLSFVLLAKQRDAMARQLADGVDTAKGRLAANRSMEDEEAGAADAVDVGGAGDRDRDRDRDRTADEAPRTA